MYRFLPKGNWNEAILSSVVARGHGQQGGREVAARSRRQYGGREVTQTQDYLSKQTKAMNMHAMLRGLRLEAQRLEENQVYTQAAHKELLFVLRKTNKCMHTSHMHTYQDTM